MSASKRYFQQVADIIANVGDSQIHGYLVREFSRVFRAQSTRFDARRFARACERHSNGGNTGGKDGQCGDRQGATQEALGGVS